MKAKKITFENEVVIKIHNFVFLNLNIYLTIMSCQNTPDANMIALNNAVVVSDPPE